MSTEIKPKPWHYSSQAFSQVENQKKDGKNYQVVNASKEDTERLAQWYLQHPVKGMTLKKVEIIHNSQMVRLFEGRITLLEQRHKSPAFDPKWPQQSQTSEEKKHREDTLAILEKRATSFKNPDHPHVKIVPLWHGTKKEMLGSLFETGFANLATTDSGFFGKGIYGAGEAEYSYRVYCQGALLVNWVAVYSAFPVIKGDMQGLMGKGNYDNYDGHFAPVVPANPNNPNEVAYYPCAPGQKYTYTELVVFDSAQVLPQYLVEFQSELLPMPSALVNSPSSLKISDLIDLIASLLGHPDVQAKSSLKQHLHDKYETLFDKPEAQPLSSEEETFYRKAKRLINEQGKLNPSIAQMLLSGSSKMSSPSSSLLIKGKDEIKTETKITPQETQPTLTALSPLRNWTANPQIQTIRGHTEAVYTLIELKDGTLASGSEDKTIKLWRRDGTYLGSLKGHTGTVNSLIELKDGTLASGSADGKIKLWKRDGSCLDTLQGYSNHASLIELEDGTLASGSSHNSIDLWHPDGTYLGALEMGYSYSSVNALIELKNGMLAAGLNNGIIKLLQRNSTCLATLTGHADCVWALIELMDGTLASSSSDKTIKLWKPDGTYLGSLKGHTDIVYSLIELKDGILASGSADGTIKLWKRDGTCLITLQGHTLPVTDLIELKDGSLASVSQDKMIKLWTFPLMIEDVASEITRFPQEPQQTLEPLSISSYVLPDWKGEPIVQTIEKVNAKTLIELKDGTLASGSGNNIKLWKRDGTCLNTFLASMGKIYTLIELKDGVLASVSEHKQIELWKRDGTRLNNSIGYAFAVTVLIELKDGTLAGGSTDGTIRLRKRDGTELATFKQTNWIRSLTELNDGTLAAGSWRSINLWKRDGTCLATLRGHTDDVYTLIELQDGVLASGSRDGTIKLWKRDGTCLATFKHTDYVSTLIELKDGTLASGSGNKIELWKRDGTNLATLWHKNAVTALVELKDGTLATGSWGDIKLWTFPPLLSYLK